MAYRNFADQEVYHLYNRGIDNKFIFHKTADYEEFLFYLKELNDTDNINIYNRKLSIKNNWAIKRGEPLVSILAYTLLPDHFHILFQAKGEKEASLFLQKISGTYTRFFNKRYKRKGPIFTHRMETVHIDNEAYFAYITYYIHLNILDLINRKWREGEFILSRKEQEFLFSYPWSSISFYLQRTKNEIISSELVENLFLEPENYKRELIDWCQRHQQVSEDKKNYFLDL